VPLKAAYNGDITKVPEARTIVCRNAETGKLVGLYGLTSEGCSSVERRAGSRPAAWPLRSSTAPSWASERLWKRSLMTRRARRVCLPMAPPLAPVSRAPCMGVAG
jgi:hypothetical protein